MTNRRSIVFDLDDTICFPNHGETDSYAKYGQAAPNQKVIDAMNKLYDQGWYIIIHSARRMLTHNGDVEKILDDIGGITEEWLFNNDVPYDELIFGKPYSHTFYVDDKAITPEQLCTFCETML